MIVKKVFPYPFERNYLSINTIVKIVSFFFNYFFFPLRFFNYFFLHFCALMFVFACSEKKVWYL